MKIAINTRFLIKDKLEGIGWFTHETIKQMVLQHPEHEFLFFFDRPYHTDFIFADNVTPVVLNPPARHPVLFYIWFEWSVTRALKRYKADVFISTDGFLSLRTNVPTILVIHDIAFKHFPEQVSAVNAQYYNYFMPKFLEKAKRIVAVSAYTKQDVVEQYGITASKIDVACNGVRSHFKPLDKSEIEAIRIKYAAGQPYFFYVGAVQPRKNVHRLIAAFDQFKTETKSTIKLLIAGRFAWKTGEVKSAYDTATHQKDIHFLGYISDDELPQLMAAAFALTYVSLFEGFGIPLLEAMHCNVPVLTSNISSMPEVVGKNGLMVNPYEVNSIKKGMLELWNKPALRQQLIQIGQIQRVQFTWDIAATVLFENINKALINR